ncbi:MAG: methyl-accepting chemotaxis protein [Chloroflexota bacterium]|nr:HAMP domain-containing protein [Chloroflexota bacterium]
MQIQRKSINPLRASGKLERKLFLFIFLTIMIPLLIGGMTAYLLAKGSVEQKEKATVSSLSYLVGDKIDHFLFERYANVQVVASNPILLREDEARNTLLKQMIQSYKVYQYIAFAGPDGKILASNLTSTQGRDMSSTSWFKTTSTTQQISVEGPTLTAETGDKRVLLFSAPVFGSNHFFEGVVNLRMDFGAIENIVNEIKIGTSGSIQLLDHEGKVLIGPNIGSSRANLLAFKEALAKGDGSVIADDESQNRIFGYSLEKGHEDYKGLGWVTLVQQDGKEAFSVTMDLGYLLIVVGVLALLAAIIMGLLIARNVARPISRISDAAKAISKGELRQSIEVNREDEIGALSHYFNDMTSYLLEMAAIASTIAVGDLTGEVKPRSENDVLGNAFNEMLKTLRTSVAQVYSNAIQVATASSELSQVASQSGAVVQQIARTIQQVARGAQEQSQSVSSTSENTLQLAHAIEQVTTGSQGQTSIVETTNESINRLSQVSERLTTSSKAIAAVAARAAMAAEMGSQSVNKTSEGMNAIRSSVANSSQTILELGEKSSLIGIIVEAIDDIADQTNLLALNAAIEAARAGEHGRGFAVVADAVRSLAERASKSTKEISMLINSVRKATEAAVFTMEQGTREVENGARLAEEAGRSLESILHEVGATNREVIQISAAADDMRRVSEGLVLTFAAVSEVAQQNSTLARTMDGNSRDVIQAIENIAVVSEENSAAAEEVSAATEEMSAQIQEMVTSVEGLAGMSDNLLMVVARFRLQEDYLDSFLAGGANLSNSTGNTLPLVSVAPSPFNNGNGTGILTKSGN